MLVARRVTTLKSVGYTLPELDITCTTASGKPSSENAFVRAAAAAGIPVRTVPEARISFYIRDVQSAFEDYFERGAGGA